RGRRSQPLREWSGRLDCRAHPDRRAQGAGAGLGAMQPRRRSRGHPGTRRPGGGHAARGGSGRLSRPRGDRRQRAGDSMPVKILNIVEMAYRATLEEREDTVLCLAHLLATGGGADMTLLVRGNAVNYLNRRQHADRLRSGETALGSVPRHADELRTLLPDGVAGYYVEEDASERGLEKADFVPGVKAVSRAGLARFVSRFERVFHW